MLRLINTILAFLTRPYFYIQQCTLLTFQSFLPTHFEEKYWYLFFGFLTFLVFVVAYVLSRCITLRDADDDPVYQRARIYSMQRHHNKNI